MTVNVDIASDVQNLGTGELINLYEIDLSTIPDGSGILRFTDSIDNDYTPIYFNSQSYTPINLETSGFEMSGEGQLPTPTIRVSNVLLTFAPYNYSYEDLVGVKFTRRRTFKKYLDGESEADPSAEFPKDIFVISRIVAQNKYMIEYELSSYMDFQGTKLPKRQIIRDTCTHKYRYYSDGDFIYTLATCPYTRDSATVPSYFNRVGIYTTTASEDVCGQSLADCEVRYACERAFADATSADNLTISDTAPGSPSEGDFWLDTDLTPNVLKRYNGTSWRSYKPDPLPTRAFPSVARMRL